MSRKRSATSEMLVGLLQLVGALALLCGLLGLFVAVLALPAWPAVNYLMGPKPFLWVMAAIALAQMCLFPVYVILLALRGVPHDTGRLPKGYRG